LIAFLVYPGSAGKNNEHELETSAWSIKKLCEKRTRKTNVTKKTTAPQTAGKRLKLRPKRPSV
jgi:endonuclease IV